MIKTIYMAGLLAACAGSLCAAASSIALSDSLVSVLAGAVLLSVGLLGRRSRVASR